ncbi:TraE/TraK family type IV conjugative transfer system protein [Sutterella megalosphaeroides]|uniref:Type IV conjugative transfer system protein TraE n=1 Tax=Sutterella megalosphaeroides TaxID=2494234 RepID=A0A2Z6IAB7_9BURK|nr:TraE/TraK family type IV conjugative transfer system protein [Sutterella megalosphaeroides]BBF23473.1 type IV conjugative transfer system protein TraE [Sutterella megalosphaeroides]
MPLLSDRVCEANRTKLVLELTVAALSVTTVLLAGAVLFRNPPVQTVVLPPSVVKDAGWTFTESGPSASYLERWSADLLSLAANLTPETADASMQRLLAHVNPEDVVRLRILLENQIEGLKADRASSVFYPNAVEVNEKALTADVSGIQKLLIGTRVTHSESVVYRLRYRYEAGRLFLRAIERVDGGNGDGAASSSNALNAADRTSREAAR